MKTKSDSFGSKQFGKNTVPSKHTKVEKNKVISTFRVPISITKKMKNKQIKGVL